MMSVRSKLSPLYIALLNARDTYLRSQGDYPRAKDRATLRAQCRLISKHMESLRLAQEKKRSRR